MQISIPEDFSIEDSQQFFEKMSKRRTVRSFLKKEIDKNILINAIKTAGTAPSGANTQPWFFGLILNQNIKNQIRVAAEEIENKFYSQESTKDWVNDLTPFKTNEKKAYLSDAPALIVVFSKTFNKLDNGEYKKTYYPIESCGIAVGMLLTALHQSGLGTLTHTPKPMKFLNQILGLDNSYRPYMIIATGLRDEYYQLPDINRKSLQEIMQEF